MSSLPKVLVVSRTGLTSHALVSCVLGEKYLRYPRAKITDGFYMGRHDSSPLKTLFASAKSIYGLKFRSPEIFDINSKIKGECSIGKPSLLYRDFVFKDISSFFEKPANQPEMILSTAYTFSDFAFLHHIYRALPKKVPIVQYFYDVDTHEDTVALFQELQPAMAEIYASTSQLAWNISRFSFMPVSVEDDPLLHSDVAFAPQKFSNTMAPCIVGPVYDSFLFRCFQNSWSLAQNLEKNIPPVAWLRTKAESGLEAEPPVTVNDTCVKIISFNNWKQAQKRLQKTNLIVVFDGTNTLGFPSKTHSCLPSTLRLAIAQGIPVVGVTQKGSLLENKISELGIGFTLYPNDTKRSAQKVIEFASKRKELQSHFKSGANSSDSKFRNNKYKDFSSVLRAKEIRISTQVLNQIFA